jgi:hypothetical protein
MSEAQAALDHTACTAADENAPTRPIGSVEATPEGVTAATSQGVAFLREARHKGFEAASPGLAPRDSVVDRATAWVPEHFDVTQNTKSADQYARVLHRLYARERLGSRSGAARVGAHDWYADAAGHLFAAKGDDVSWDDGAASPVPNTCFALLVRSRSTDRLR